jgi:hypothetical protein
VCIWCIWCVWCIIVSIIVCVYTCCLIRTPTCGEHLVVYHNNRHNYITIIDTIIPHILHIYTNDAYICVITCGIHLVTHTHTYTHIHTQIHTHTHTYTHTHTHTHTHIHIHIHIHTHTHIHIHIHITCGIHLVMSD